MQGYAPVLVERGRGVDGDHVERVRALDDHEAFDVAGRQVAREYAPGDVGAVDGERLVIGQPILGDGIDPSRPLLARRDGEGELLEEADVRVVRIMDIDGRGIESARQPHVVAARLPAADQLCRILVAETRRAVPDEDVGNTICVASHEIGRRGLERDNEAETIDRDRKTEARGIRLAAVACHADTLGDPLGPITHKDIGMTVGVAGDQVARRRHEADRRAVPADPSALAVPDRFGAVVGHAHPAGLSRFDDPG